MATEVVAFRTSCGIVSARLSANNGRARASRASKSDGCLALLKRTSYIKQGRRLDRDTTNVVGEPGGRSIWKWMFQKWINTQRFCACKADIELYYASIRALSLVSKLSDLT